MNDACMQGTCWQHGTHKGVVSYPMKDGEFRVTRRRQRASINIIFFLRKCQQKLKVESCIIGKCILILHRIKSYKYHKIIYNTK